MNIWIYDKNFNRLQYLDGIYESFIWTTRYNKPGDFEILIPIESKFKDNLKIDNYLELADANKDKTTMLIETVSTETSEDGTHISVKGRSIDSILERRIIWTKHEYKFDKSKPIYIYNIINTLMTENVITCHTDNKWHGVNETDAKKRILPIRFDISQLSEDVKKLKIYEDLEFYNDDMLNMLQTLCEDKHFNLGYKMVRNKADNFFDFTLFKGKDRTKGNTQGNQLVQFSNRLGNLPKSSYLESKATLKNFTRIEYNDKTTYYPSTDATRVESGIDRREINTSPSLSNAESSSVTDALLQTKGKQDLMENKITKTFEGEVIDSLFKCDIDYTTGDIIEFENEFGDKDKARIVEIVRTSDLEGDKIYPSLESTSEDKEEIS